MKQVMKIAEAMDSEKEKVKLQESPGRITGEYIYLYPPGIPLLVPGEEIPETLPDQIQKYQMQGLDVQGLSDMSNQTILVLRKN